jgi:ATP synthase F1 complex assembly factor 2
MAFYSLTKLLKLNNASSFIRCTGSSIFMSSLSNKERKRFYKNVSICESSDQKNMFEINLDKRKLKTPTGKVFQVDNEMLANMICQEWQSQTNVIKLTTMHLTSLTNTFLDNPNKLSKQSICSSLNEYLKTDTILYFEDSNPNLFKLQLEKWKPIVDWFNSKFTDLNLTIKQNDNLFQINGGLANDTNNSFLKYLDQNFDLNTIIALNYMCECLKSVILSVALLERAIENVSETCELANLEQLFQNEKWGKVEWYHDINEQEVKSRVSSALIFIYLSNKSKYLIVKNSKQIQSELF